MKGFPHFSVALLPLLSALQLAQAQDLLNWTNSSTNPTEWAVSADGSVMTDPGATITLRATTSTPSGYGSVTAGSRADTLAGRRVRISADIETKGDSTIASVWLRADSGRKVLIFGHGFDQALRGTTTTPKHMVVTVFVPSSATSLAFGLTMRGGGEATAHNVRVMAGPAAAPGAQLPPDAQRELDSAFSIVRRASLWRDTVTWTKVEPEVRAAAAGSQTAADTYPAIRLLLTRLGDHHSFLKTSQSAAEFSSGGAQNPQPTFRLQTSGVGYISVPAYSGANKAAAERYVQSVYDSLSYAVTHDAGSCRWVVDLRSNEGGNMWPMLGGLRPFLGEVGVGSFVSPSGSAPLWHARDQVNVKPPAVLASLDSANVAVLIGPQTASSGEAVAISFIGRPHTRTFGMPTMGLSTSNRAMPLPDGALILLTTAVEADRTGKRYGEKVIPDEVIPAASKDSTDDPQLQRAVAWLRQQQCL